MARPDFRKDVAEEMIRQIEAGTAPWQKPWQPGMFRLTPHNPVSGSEYKGINAWWLEMQGRQDPRWLTYRQASAAGAQVRKGEKSTWVEHWKWTERVPALDDNKQPILDDAGKQIYKEVRLTRPQVFYAAVFNAEQVDGLEPFIVPEPQWAPVDRAEDLIKGAGVPVFFDQADRAFYNPVNDHVRMPPPAAFTSQYEFYATQLHEIGHATGHANRLARDFGPFGSAAYAREELRAEMASFMLATEVGLGHFPERHAGYVESWLGALKDDKNLLFQAARDAETIRQWVVEADKRPELEKQAKLRKEGEKMAKQQAAEPAKSEAAERKRVYIAVPFEEKNEAKALGARWDRKAKSWYVPAGLEAAKFSRWAIENVQAEAASRDPVEEFSEALRSSGLLVDGPAVMDGRWHRVPVIDDAKGQLSGSYRGFLDGRPNGQIMNYRLGDKVEKWVATGEKIDPAKLLELKAQSAKRKTELEAEIRQKQKATAERALKIFAGAVPSDGKHAFLIKKGVRSFGLKADKEGNLLVPLTDINGKIHNVQIINDFGRKRYLKGGKKEGLMHKLAGADTGPIIIAEGYSTAASIREASGNTVIAAFDAGNLDAVASVIRRQHPDRELIFAADNDVRRQKNVGLVKAVEAAERHGGLVAVPEFFAREQESGMTDFNDLHHARGLPAVKEQISMAVPPALVAAKMDQVEARLFEERRILRNEVSAAFDRAIADGRLSRDEKAPNWAGNFMFMETVDGIDQFKHSDTREYLPRADNAPPARKSIEKPRSRQKEGRSAGMGL